MFIPEKLKLNKFRDCAIPSNRDYFVRFGFQAPPAGSFTGEVVAPYPMNKVEEIEDFEKYAEMKAKEESEKHVESDKGE